MAFNNSINANTAGVVGVNASGAWTGTPVTQYQVILGGATSEVLGQVSGIGTSGQVLTSSGSDAPTWATPASTGAYVNVTEDAQVMAVNTGYVTNDPDSIVTYTPPATCAVGTTFAICGNSADGWTIDLAANTQTINFGDSPATTALASTNPYDAVKFVCTVLNSTFSVIDCQGNLNVS